MRTRRPWMTLQLDDALNMPDKVLRCFRLLYNMESKAPDGPFGKFS